MRTRRSRTRAFAASSSAPQDGMSRRIMRDRLAAAGLGAPFGPLLGEQG